MWVLSDIIQGQQWTARARRKSKGKVGASYCNVASVSSKEAETGDASLTDSKEEESAFFADQDVPPSQELDLTNNT